MGCFVLLSEIAILYSNELENEANIKGDTFLIEFHELKFVGYKIGQNENYECFYVLEEPETLENVKKRRVFETFNVLLRSRMLLIEKLKKATIDDIELE